jgi:hypothetical protein
MPRPKAPIDDDTPDIDLSNDPKASRCEQSAPCGHRCVLRAGNRHVYHSCNNHYCILCHGSMRFPRKRIDVSAYRFVVEKDACTTT